MDEPVESVDLLRDEWIMRHDAQLGSAGRQLLQLKEEVESTRKMAIFLAGLVVGLFALFLIPDREDPKPR